MASWENASQSELAAAAQAIDREYKRRETMDQAAKAEQFRQELDEIRAGTRAVGDEHIGFLTPLEVQQAINKGLVPGVGADKRLRRGR